MVRSAVNVHNIKPCTSENLQNLDMLIQRIVVIENFSRFLVTFIHRNHLSQLL